MADVKIHKCFPTLVHEFRLNLNHDKMIDYIYNVGEAKGQIHQSPDDLHKYGMFEPLVNELDLIHDSILRKLEYKFDKIEITNMWSNHLYSGDSHPPHTHSNNFLSGVYYLEAEDGAAPIQFFDPRPQSNVLRPRNKASWQNCSMIQFDAIKGVGYIFPSWLQHWVPPTDGKRISISWNIILRGEYGEPGTLQNANI